MKRILSKVEIEQIVGNVKELEERVSSYISSEKENGTGSKYDKYLRSCMDVIVDIYEDLMEGRASLVIFNEKEFPHVVYQLLIAQGRFYHNMLQKALNNDIYKIALSTIHDMGKGYRISKGTYDTNYNVKLSTVAINMSYFYPCLIDHIATEFKRNGGADKAAVFGMIMPYEMGMQQKLILTGVHPMFAKKI